jgi:hypothetical protein
LPEQDSSQICREAKQWGSRKNIKQGEPKPGANECGTSQAAVQGGIRRQPLTRDPHTVSKWSVPRELVKTERANTNVKVLRHKNSHYIFLSLDHRASGDRRIGLNALYSNTTGDNNTASGFEALYFNINGNYNNASGYYALHSNSSGSQNSASGVQALYSNKTGNYNTASGTDALYSNSTGSTNIAAGYKAGYNLTTGSNNIDIGNVGVAAESGTIRIGTTATQTATYIAGIYGTSVTGSAVVVSSTGQLGVTVSSERFKTAITSMGSNSMKLQQLRPVTFHLKTDPEGALQYGLIAEEVAKVYPELVIRDKTGRIDGVRYDELAPMILNEMQQQLRKNAKQSETIASQGAQLRTLQKQLIEIHAALLKLQAKGNLVAQR